jgi:hypothetical protein
MEGQAEATGQALMVALRTLEERIRLLQRMAGSDRRQRRGDQGAEYERRAGELKQHANTLRAFLAAGYHPE